MWRVRVLTDVEKQEEVVVALWEFARAQRDRKPDAGENAAAYYVNLSAVHEALERIMDIFGLDVVPID